MTTKAITGVGLYRDDFNVPGDCPRCGSPLPVGYVGALSRADNVTEVCSACGTDEALESFATGRPPTPTAKWPIERLYANDEWLADQTKAMDLLLKGQPGPR
jgi:hypothetical protein